MIILINGFREDVPEQTTIAQVLEYHREEGADLIVEHNSRFVYPRTYSGTVLADGDRLEFIRLNIGG